MRWLLLLLLAGCPREEAGMTLPRGNPDVDASVFEPCYALCFRPSDCELAFTDDGLCPPGFRCSQRFSCNSDGGLGD